MAESPFVEAVRVQFEKALKAHRQLLMKNMLRDARGLPTVEAELGWRIAFRGPQARD